MSVDEFPINEYEMWGEQGRAAALDKLSGTPYAPTAPSDTIGVHFQHDESTGWRYHSRSISDTLTKTQGDRFRCILNNACSELNEHVGNPRVSEPLTAEDALTQIHEAIDWQNWTPKRVEEIAAILRRTGKDVHSADEIPF